MEKNTNNAKCTVKKIVKKIVKSRMKIIRTIFKLYDKHSDHINEILDIDEELILIIIYILIPLIISWLYHIIIRKIQSYRK